MPLTREQAAVLAAAVMRRLTIYAMDCGDLTDESNKPDPDILDDLTDLLEAQ